MFKSAALILFGISLGLVASGIPDSIAQSASMELGELPKPYYSVLWENENIRIVEHKLNAGESEPMHSHPHMVGYFLETSTVRITESDGTVSEPTLVKGTIGDVGPWTHEIENIGESPLHSLIVELKPRADAPNNR